MEFVKTLKAKPMPLDPDPVPDGNVYVLDGIAHVLRRGQQPPAGAVRRRAHFSTCPNWGKP